MDIWLASYSEIELEYPYLKKKNAVISKEH